MAGFEGFEGAFGGSGGYSSGVDSNTSFTADFTDGDFIVGGSKSALSTMQISIIAAVAIVGLIIYRAKK